MLDVALSVPRSSRLEMGACIISFIGSTCLPPHRRIKIAAGREHRRPHCHCVGADDSPLLLLPPGSYRDRSSADLEEPEARTRRALGRNCEEIRHTRRPARPLPSVSVDGWSTPHLRHSALRRNLHGRRPPGRGPSPPQVRARRGPPRAPLRRDLFYWLPPRRAQLLLSSTSLVLAGGGTPRASAIRHEREREREGDLPVASMVQQRCAGRGLERRPAGRLAACLNQR